MTFQHEESPFKSKKFLAYLVSDISLKALGVLILAWAWNLDEVSMTVFALLLAIIVVSGFLSVGFILGQAGLDRYVRLAQIAAQGAVNGTTNGSMTRIVSKGTGGMIKAKEPAEGTVDKLPEAGEEENKP